MQNTNSVLIVGGGIAGATVAHRLSQAGVQVHLIEKKSAIGGHVTEMGCKATDTCLRCNVCVANELLRNVQTSSGINIQTSTELKSLEPGMNGSRYTAILKHKPNYIDRNKCIGCLACVESCPEKCIALPNSTATPAVPVLDYSSCRRASGRKCSICEQTCPVKATNMQDKSSESRIDIDNIVVAMGHEPYDPAENASYNYGGAENIITGAEAERQLSIEGKITRLSDGQEPKRIAFIQCVGSRTEEIHRRPEDTDYCSTVCCTYALRIAQLIRHRNEDAEITIFYMDIQNFGKDFNEFYNKCKNSMTFIRSRPYEIKQGSNGTLQVKFAPQSLEEGAQIQVSKQQFDMVVLSVGIRPAQNATELAEKLRLPMDEQGFFGFKNASALPELQQQGIFVAGTCESPKDIKSCMAQAEAVSVAIIGKVS